VASVLVSSSLTWVFLGMLRCQVVIDDRRLHSVGEILSFLAFSMARDTRSSLDNILRLHRLGVISSFRHVGVITHKILVGTVGTVNVNLVASVRSDEGSQRHNVLCKSSSLIGTDDSNTSERFDRWKGTDNGI
jgi:hypothetical protein